MSICQFTNHQQISTNMFCNQTIFWANHIPHAPRFFASNSLTRSCICQSLCFLRGVFFSAGAAGVSGVLHARSFKAWKKKLKPLVPLVPSGKKCGNTPWNPGFRCGFCGFHSDTARPNILRGRMELRKSMVSQKNKTKMQATPKWPTSIHEILGDPKF